jgi:hypothetical protein
MNLVYNRGPMPPISDFGFFQIEFRAREADDYPTLPDVNYFLHDLNLLYELTRVISDAKYRDFHFSRFFAYRNRQRIETDDQLRIQRLSQESPLTVVAVVAAVPSAAVTILALVQVLEKIANFSLKRDILKLTRDKLRSELAKAPAPHVDLSGANFERFVEQVHIREAEYIYDKVADHLRENPVQIREIEITYVRGLPRKTDEEE